MRFYKARRFGSAGLERVYAELFSQLRVAFFHSAGKLALFFVGKVYAQIQQADARDCGKGNQRRNRGKPRAGIGNDVKDHDDQDADGKGDGSADEAGIFDGLLFLKDSVHLHNLLNRIAAFADISQKPPGKSTVVGKVCHGSILLIGDERQKRIHICKQSDPTGEQENRTQRNEGVREAKMPGSAALSGIVWIDVNGARAARRKAL